MASNFEFYHSVALLIKTLPPENRERHFKETKGNVEKAFGCKIINDEERTRLISLLKDQ